MQLVITSHNLGLWAAAHICNRWKNSSKRPFVLGLPTGGTVEEMYAALSGLVKNGKMTFKDIISFNMDEYVGLSPEHPQSYHYYMHHHLFSHVDEKPENIHILNGQAADLDAECANYETAIKQVGGIDLFMGGIGRNGHLAFNEPGSAFDSRTRVIELTQSTIDANSRFFNNDPTQVPTRALSIGIGTLLDAREILILAAGASKAEAILQLVKGEVSTQWPVTALKNHAHATVLIDKEAASRLGTDILTQFDTLRKEDKDLVLSL